MRRILLCTLFALLVAIPATAGVLEDEFSFLEENELFVQFMDACRNEGNASKAEALRTQMLADERDLVSTIRSATVLARLYTELPKPDYEKAKVLLAQAEELLAGFEPDSFPFLILGAEIDSIHYLIPPKNIGKGIKSNSKIQKAYKQYPDQVSSLLMKANSLLYAPSFAGGDVHEALDIYLRLLEEGKDLLLPWDMASLYSGIGVSCIKLKKWELAHDYLLAAKALYDFDPAIDAHLNTMKEHL